MCVAMLAFVACEKKQGGGGGGDDPQTEYKQVIQVNDNSLADWANVPQDMIVTATCPEDAALLGLKSVKVYADKYFIFIIAEPDPKTVTDLSWTPFHVYIDTDNSDATGGYGDEFKDPNADVLLEGVVYADGAPVAWGPAVFHWWGAVGEGGWIWQDPSVEHSGDDKWGADVGEGELQGTTSQFIDGKFEIQIMRELVPTPAGWNEDEIGIGFDIQQSWSSVGVLPLVSPTEDNPYGYTMKLKVKIDK